MHVLNKALFYLTLGVNRLLPTDKWNFGWAQERLLDPFYILCFITSFANSYFCVIGQIRKSTLIIWTSRANSHSTFATMMLAHSDFAEKFLTNKTVRYLWIHPKGALSFLYGLHPFMILVSNNLYLIEDKSEFLLFTLNFDCKSLFFIILTYV